MEKMDLIINLQEKKYQLIQQECQWMKKISTAMEMSNYLCLSVILWRNGFINSTRNIKKLLLLLKIKKMIEIKNLIYISTYYQKKNLCYNIWNQTQFRHRAYVMKLIYYDRQDIFLKGEGEGHPSNDRDNNLLRSQSAEMLSTSSRSK